MKIIGIDPGTARMGFSVVRTDKKGSFIDVLETSVLITLPEMPMQQRLLILYNGLFKIMKKHKPSIMVIEKLFCNTNVKTAMTVGQARGVALLSAAATNMTVYEYTALEAKRSLTGYGRSSKKEMQEAVKDKLNLESIVKSDDANDAIAMALCYIKKSLLHL